MKTIAELEVQYKEHCAKFKSFTSAKKKDFQEDDTPREIRKLAQDGFTLANELKIRFTEMVEQTEEGSKDRLEFSEKCSFYEKEVVSWTKWLKKYGSPISGIPKTTFNDIAGLESVKETIKDYLFMLKNPEVAAAYNINTNLGILLYGPPGTGKTLVAEAIAHELNVRYFVITPSQIFGSYVGESEKNVRDVFEELRACTDGAVLLIDECESIFARRESGTNRAAIGVANQLLQEMNGQGDLPSSKRVIIGATNRPELMDEAYLRFKRFSLQFYIGMPNSDAKERVVDLCLKKRPYENEFREKLLLHLLNDNLYTCADISGIIEQCAYMALSECRHMAEENDSVKFGKTADYIKMKISHLDAVLKKYPRSVTQDMLDEYEEFRKSRVNGG